MPNRLTREYERLKAQLLAQFLTTQEALAYQEGLPTPPPPPADDIPWVSHVPVSPRVWTALEPFARGLDRIADSDASRGVARAFGVTPASRDVRLPVPPTLRARK